MSAPVGAYDKTTFKGATITSTANVYTLGASYRMKSMRFMASYGQLDTGAVVDPNAGMIGVGAQYFLSKRTNMYVSFGSKDFDGANVLTSYGIGVSHTF